MLASDAWTAALLYAVVRSVCAFCASASAEWITPFTVPGGKPVTEVPGLTPTFPVMVLGPVFVTDWPPRTAKLSASPSGTATPIAWAGIGSTAIPAATASMRVLVTQEVNPRR